jgi:hypothetical protein
MLYKDARITVVNCNSEDDLTMVSMQKAIYQVPGSSARPEEATVANHINTR